MVNMETDQQAQDHADQHNAERQRRIDARDCYDMLRDAASPDAFCAVLEMVADQLRYEGAELDGDWQDDSAGQPWRNIARDLDKTAGKYGAE